MGALETLLANSNAAPPTPQATSGGALEKLLAGGDSAGPATPAPSKPAAKGGVAKFGEDLLGGTADAIDLVFDLVSAPVAMAADTGTRAYLGARNLAGGRNLSRREISVAGNEAAGAVSEAIGGPARKALQALGILPPGEGLVGKAMARGMEIAGQAGANLEANSGGAILKEDVLTGVSMLFGALGAKGIQHMAKTSADVGRAKAALKELAKIKEEANARLAAADAEALNREAGGIPREALPGDNPAARYANLPAFDQRVNAERQAYELMQTGASKAKVEGIIKKNPAVGVALDDIRKKRESFSAFLQEDPNLPEALGGTADLQRLSEIEGARARGEWVSPADLEKLFNARVAMQPRGEIKIEPAGSGQVTMTAERIRAALLGRRSEMGPAELEARDFAAGIQRGPLGEPIFSANPQARNPQRSSRDPSRRPVTDSGLEGLPVKRDSLGTPLSPNQTLAVVGATGLGLAAYYAAEGDTSDVAAAAAGGALLLGKGRGIGLDAIRALPDTTTLREIRDASAYTLNTLENLPGNRAVHSKQAVSELLRRQEVTKAERDILQGVLDSVPGETITAKQLMAGVKEATGDFELKPVASEKFADYGLENIDRAARAPEDAYAWIPENATPEEAARLEAEAQAEFARMPEAATTIYQSPFELGTNNHFSDPNYFAHTRSFYENGIKHVVEMQSDLAQKAGKVLGAEERALFKVQQAEAVSIAAAIDKSPTRGLHISSPDWPELTAKHLESLPSAARRIVDGKLEKEFKFPPGMGITKVVEHFRNNEVPLKERRDFNSVLMQAVAELEVRASELQAKLETSGSVEPIQPMLKRWDRRLVREELAASARGRENPKYAEAQEFLAGMQRGADDFMERQGRLKPDEAAGYYEGVEKAKADIAAQGIPERFPPEPVVRFATADTVAKVEGWPEARPTEAVIQLREAQFELESVKELGYKPGEFTYDRAVEDLAAKEAAVAKEPKPSRFSPEHQGIYDRYQKEVTSFLKQLGGKEVTDSAGHTWIEVPTEGTRKMPAGRRVQQFGAADPELVKALGAVSGGVMVASLLSDDESKVRNAALTAVGVSLAMFGRSRVTGLSEMAKAAVGGAERYLGTVSTRVANMSPRLLRRMREHERGVLTRTNAYLQAIGPFVEGLRQVPEALRRELDAAILTGNPAKITAVLGRTGKPELVAQFRKARALLDKVGAELMQAGKLKGLLSDYYPRIVVDVPGLLKAIGAEERTFIEKQIAEASRRTMKEALRDLTPFEVSQIINKALKGGPRGNGRSGFLQGRVVKEVTPELAAFYAPASESLPLYLRAVSKELERARFFGENLVRDPVTGATHLDESIGNVVREEQLAGRINPEQAMELGEILRSRFGPGERATSRPLQAVKNLAYAGLLGHVTSAITQLGDVAISAAAHGILPTLKAIQQNLTRKPARATVHDLGMIDHMAEEIVSASRTPVTVMGRQVSTAKFLEKVFKYSGFSWVDSVGKNVSIQASKNKLEGWAKTPAGLKRLQAKYGSAYTPAEMQQLVADLRSGELSELVKGVLFSELSDVQPISKLEVPQAYLDNPNGRVLYMLKTFMLKQADIVRREVYQNIRKGNYKQAMEKGTRFGLALGIGGATTQWINNWLLGRDQEPELTDIPLNALKTFGWSQYTLDKVKQGKPLEAAADVAAPPYKMFDTIISQDPAAMQYIPVVGRIYYARDWFDLLEESGSEKANRRLEREERRKEREE